MFKILLKFRLLLLIALLAWAGVLLAFPYETANKHCTGVYVGKNLTASGNVLIGQCGDESSSHWIEVVPRGEYGPGSVLEVGAGPKADYPGMRTAVPQVPATNRYLTVRYSEYAGFEKPLENGGVNEHQVAVIDVWAPSRDELRKMTPGGQKGLTYSDEARVAMERARTAREAVQIIGSLINKYGHSTYGGNTHMVADTLEGWIIEEFAGGGKLWVAARLGPDDIKVIRPGFIEEIPLDYKENPNYAGSDRLISFAIEKGWYDRSSGKPFKVSEVYEGDIDKDSPGHQAYDKDVINGEKFLRERTPGITVRDIMLLFKQRPYSNRATKYGQVTELRAGLPAELCRLWIALGPPETSLFLPFYLGISNVPIQYGEHRYLTRGESERASLPRERQGQETTEYAYRTFDRVYMLADEHYEKFCPEVMETFNAVEQKLLEEQETIEQTALILLKAGRKDLAEKYLTDYTSTTALEGLKIADAIARALLARTEALFGIHDLPEADN